MDLQKISPARNIPRARRPASRSAGAAGLQVWILFAASLLAQPDPPRVDPAAALQQLVRRVEPEIPESAISARVFGTVVAEIVVGTTGRVESVRITRPVPMLSGPAADAIRQWEFKPFLIAGKAARILTEVSIDFPKPAATATGDPAKAYYDAAVNCRTQVESRSAQALSACREAIARADALPAEHWDRRSEARFLAAQAAMNATQYPAAVALFDESLALWLRNKPTDVRVAQHHLLIGLAHRSNRDLPSADAAFARAVASYDERIADGLVIDDVVRQELEALFTNYGAVRRALKDDVGARALEARAAKTTGARAPAPPPPVARRTIAGTLCIDDGCAQLDEADVTDALKRLPPKTRVWFIDAGSDKAPPAGITLYLERDRDLPGLRRGRTLFLTKKISAQGRWERVAGADPEWAQLTAADRSVTDLRSRDDGYWPFLIRSSGRTGSMSDDDLLAVLMTVRSAAAATRARNLPDPRLAIDVQPWPVGAITLTGPNGADVYLKSPERGALPQTVTLTREDDVWKVSGIKSGT